MKLHNLKPAEGGGAKRRKRVGRGHGSGWGKLSGRGRDGQNSRSGGGVRPGFEGGQMPLFRRLPKRGFKNINEKQYGIVNLRDLNSFEANSEITPEVLFESGMIKRSDAKDGVKVLGDGELDRALFIKADKFSKGAEEKIVAQGGKAEVI